MKKPRSSILDAGAVQVPARNNRAGVCAVSIYRGVRVCQACADCLVQNFRRLCCFMLASGFALFGRCRAWPASVAVAAAGLPRLCALRKRHNMVDHWSGRAFVNLALIRALNIDRPASKWLPWMLALPVYVMFAIGSPAHIVTSIVAGPVPDASA